MTRQTRTGGGLVCSAVAGDSAESRGRTLRAVRTKEVDPENRRAFFVASTAEVDRHGDAILPSAFEARIGKFQRHSPFLANHQPWVEGGAPTQIGTVHEMTISATDVRIGVTYAETDMAEQYWKLARDPQQSVAVSIGFIPLERERGRAADLAAKYPVLKQPFADAGLADADTITVYTQIELLEVSQVAVPANSEAVQLSDAGPAGKADRVNLGVIHRLVRPMVEKAVADIRAEMRREQAAFKTYVAEQLDMIACTVLRHVGQELETDDAAGDADGDADTNAGGEALTVPDASARLLAALGVEEGGGA